MAHFSSINARIEVSEITHRNSLCRLIDTKTAAIIIKNNEILNLWNILYLPPKLYFSTIVLLQKMVGQYLVHLYVWKLDCIVNVLYVVNNNLLIKWETWLGVLLARSLHFDIELNSKLIELLNLHINQSQLNIKLAFIFQQHFNLIFNWRQLKNSYLNLSCIEKWTCGTSSTQCKILTHQLTVHG